MLDVVCNDWVSIGLGSIPQEPMVCISSFTCSHPFWHALACSVSDLQYIIPNLGAPSNFGFIDSGLLAFPKVIA